MQPHIKKHSLSMVTATAICLIAGTSVLAAEPDFDLDIMPILTRYGCNSGACHGAAAGRGGLHLSLFGSRPADDYVAITDELEGRRVNLVHPELSLIIQKPTCRIDHEGDIRFEDDSEACHRLIEWIRAGAKRSANSVETSMHVVVTPEVFEMVPGVGGQNSASGTIQVYAGVDAAITRARPALAVQDTADSLADSSARPPVEPTALTHATPWTDVTRWTVLTPSDPSTVTIDASGKVVVHRAGQHVVIARYLNHVRPIILTVPFESPGTIQQQDVSTNFTSGNAHDATLIIDQTIDRKLAQLNLSSAGPVDDDAFLRRVTLDLVGRLPTLEEQAAFAHDQRDDKRHAKIDELISSNDFVSFWTFRLGQMLRSGISRNSAATAAFHDWLRTSLHAEMPMDELVSQLLLAEGDPGQNGAVYFYLATNDARAQAEFFSEALLGVRLRCANCHDHPLDQWTQDDYHGLAAIFARIQREPQVRFTDQGTVVHPATGMTGIKRVPGSHYLADSTDGRRELLKWILNPEKPLFAKAFVNRIWNNLMGRGIVDPTDDLRETNPATLPKVWEELTSHFVDSGYNLKNLVRTVCQSRAYSRQLISVRSPTSAFYDAALPKPMEPHVLLDAICDVTGVPQQWDASQRDAANSALRATQLVNPLRSSEALELLGRCPPGQPCQGSTSPQTAPDLPLSLHLINGSLLNDKLRASTGRIGALIREEVNDATVIERFYRLALCRSCTSQESDYWQRQLSQADNDDQRRQVIEDFVWALLTSDEFLTIR